MLAMDQTLAGGANGEPAPCPEAETVMGVLAHLAPERVPEFMLVPLYEGQHAVISEAGFDRALEGLAAAGLVHLGRVRRRRVASRRASSGAGDHARAARWTRGGIGRAGEPNA